VVLKNLPKGLVSSIMLEDRFFYGQVHTDAHGRLRRRERVPDRGVGGDPNAVIVWTQHHVLSGQEHAGIEHFQRMLQMVREAKLAPKMPAHEMTPHSMGRKQA